jgi:hypothetical protein
MDTETERTQGDFEMSQSRNEPDDIIIFTDEKGGNVIQAAASAGYVQGSHAGFEVAIKAIGIIMPQFILPDLAERDKDLMNATAESIVRTLTEIQRDAVELTCKSIPLVKIVTEKPEGPTKFTVHIGKGTFTVH